MHIKDVIWFLELAQQGCIPLWIDGGWGVDALLKRQTRRHDDLDIVVEAQHRDPLVCLLSAHGFALEENEKTCDWNFVMCDDLSRTVDFHVIDIDSTGRGIYGPIELGKAYPSSALKGLGRIGPLQVRCISAEYQLQSHDAGYALRPCDVADMKHLCLAFDMDLPDRFKS